MRPRRAALIACCAWTVAVLAACGPHQTDHATLADAKSAGAVAQGLLPDGLPQSTALIRIEHAEDRASGCFHSCNANHASMRSRVEPLARLPADPVLQDWVRRKDLAGYDAYTFRHGERIWLLLCASNKGRCYFRLLG